MVVFDFCNVFDTEYRSIQFMFDLKLIFLLIVCFGYYHKQFDINTLNPKLFDPKSSILIKIRISKSVAKDVI